MKFKLKINSASFKKRHVDYKFQSVTGNSIDNSHLHTRQKPSEADFIIIILLILTVLLICLVSFVGHIVYQEISSVYSKSLDEFPVPCEDLSLSPYEDAEIYDVKRNGLKTFIGGGGKYICSSNNLTKLVEMVLERQSRLRLAKGLDGPWYRSCGNESLAPKSGNLAVGFTKLSRHQNFYDSELDAKLLWNNDQAKSYIDPSVHYDDGEITIPEGRTYFIYTSVHFNLSRGRGENPQHIGRSYQLSVRICRKVFDYEQTLLGRTRLFNISSVNDATSLRIGSHLQMSRNDKIYVKVSGAKRLIPDSKGNTFGFFPL